MTLTDFLLIGLSKASAYALYPLIGLYLLLPVYTVLGGWQREGDRQQIRLLWFLVLPTAAFLALWLCGRVIWTLFLWLWVGEGYVQYESLASGTFAVAVAAIFLVRLATGRFGNSYVRINTWGMGLCVGLISAMYLIEFAQGIDGWTARGAAENRLAHLMDGSKFYPAHLPRRLVDETTPQLVGKNGKAFALYIGDALAAEIHVMPYYRWWWTLSYRRISPYGKGKFSTKEQIQRLRESLKN
jgi:hypothetical protein